jgi:UDP-glucose 4-epimerase
VNVLLLGGTGFIGARVARRLMDRGEHVTCLDLNPNPSALGDLRDKVAIVRGDVTKADDIAGAIRGGRVQRVANLAYLLNAESAQDPDAAVRVNALGMSNVFEASRALDVERVVFASSVAVYGDQTLYGERPVTEEDIPSPRGLYGAAKLLNEYQAAIYRETFGLSVVGIRMSVVFGHGRQRGQGLWAGQFASNPAMGGAAALPFDRRMCASMIYVDDVAELLVRALVTAAPRYGVYNSGGEVASLETLAAMVRAQISGAQISFGSGSTSLPYLLDSSRAEAEFAWSRGPLEARIADHIAEARRTGGQP